MAPTETGGGEVARLIGRHGTRRVGKAVLIGSLPPPMLETTANPGGSPRYSASFVAARFADRSRFWKDLSTRFYGHNRPGTKILEGVREQFWFRGMMTGFPSCARKR